MKCQSNFFLCSTCHCWRSPDWHHMSMGWAQPHSHRHMLRSSFWGTLCCPEVCASSTPFPPCSHHGLGFYTRAKLEVTLAMNIFMEESNQTPRTWCNILPKAGSSCVLRAAHSQLYPHEIFIERKLYNLSRQSGPSLTVLVGTCLSYQQSHLPEPQQVTCRMDNSIYWTVTERGLVCLANQNFGGFQFWPRGPGADFSLYKSCSQAVTQQNWVRWAGGSGFLLLPTVAVSSKSGWDKSTRPYSSDTMEIVINFCCLFIYFFLNSVRNTFFPLDNSRGFSNTVQQSNY